ncbi:Ras association domain-containing protein 2 [Nymphon striatum]|nr:Ras association domain-containing protein 2 [Nymphon striatum]
MSTCRKCSKPVYFAERKTSLGYEWHPKCLTCEECGKRLNPGQHAEHKGVPYCHIPCYSALFGPTLFGHGSRVESHTSFGKIENRQATHASRGHVEAKLKIYNQHYEGKSGELKCRERNGRLILEGVLRIYWGVSSPIYLKEEHDSRIPVVCKRNSYKPMSSNLDELLIHLLFFQNDKENNTKYNDVKYKTLPTRLDSSEKNKSEEEEKQFNLDDLYVSTPNVIYGSEEETPSKPRLRRRRGGNAKLKRRCSINGHFYNRETSVFTPVYGSVTHVWVTSLVNTTEVINMLLDKFKVENSPKDFALFVVRENGERRFIEADEYPLLTRVMLGPHEEVAKVFIMNKAKTEEISPEVAQYIQLSEPELKAIVDQFFEEEAREVEKIKKKYVIKFRDRQRKLEYYQMQLDIMHRYGLYGGGDQESKNSQTNSCIEQVTIGDDTSATIDNKSSETSYNHANNTFQSSSNDHDNLSTFPDSDVKEETSDSEENIIEQNHL